jgi:hypothetical protein
MITDPAKLFEEVQNEVAARIKARPLFQGLKMPDGADFDVLTEDEGEPEMLFTQQVAQAGLCILVQSPTGKLTSTDGGLVLEANPLVLAVSISEAVIFNRDPNGTGTKVRLMKAVIEVFKAVHRFAPPSLQTKLFATRLLKDRDTQPGSDDLVATRIITFEATEVSVDLS